MAKIIVTYGVPAEGFAALSAHEVIIPKAGERFSKQEMISILPDCDAVLACTAFDKEMIEAAKQLRLIVCYGAGYDAIDVAAATEHGIPVVNTPDCVTAPTAELACSLLMALARRLGELDAVTRAEPAQNVFVMGKRMGTSLEGATLGIVGMGRIGMRVARFGRAMGMRIVYHARHAKPECDALGDEWMPLERLMSVSDFISIHCPHTAETEGLISRELIACMKPTAFLINTARGAVLDEDALIDALASHRIAGAGLDVYQGEPNIDPRLLTLPNVLLTPHVGANTHQARFAMAQAASERILAVLAGRRPQNLINPEIWKN